jgi:hypothetical protein
MLDLDGDGSRVEVLALWMTLTVPRSTALLHAPGNMPSSTQSLTWNCPWRCRMSGYNQT